MTCEDPDHMEEPVRCACGKWLELGDTCWDNMCTDCCRDSCKDCRYTEDEE